MALDRGHLHRPDHVGRVVHTEFVRVPVEARKVDPNGFDPGRRTSRQPLLVHLLTVHPVREAVQHAGPVVKGIDDAVSDREVVARKIELCLAALGEVDPIGVADLDDPITDLEFDTLRGHAGTIPWPPGAVRDPACRKAAFDRARTAWRRSPFSPERPGIDWLPFWGVSAAPPVASFRTRPQKPLESVRRRRICGLVRKDARP